METTAIAMLNRIKATAPLIHNITNFVVMNSSANILLAVGASPVMAHSRAEAGEMAAMSSALVLNIGTLEKAWLDSMIMAGRAANEFGVPVVLDPVGAGATKFRSKAVEKIMSSCSVAVLRGNASEVLSMGSADIKTRGVESSFAMSDDATEDIRAMAAERKCIIAVSGLQDCITDGTRVFRVENGHPVMTRVTGIGCGLSAVAGAFCAVDDGLRLEAVTSAFAFYGRCAELAAAVSDKPGSFYTAFIDTLQSAGESEITRGLKVREE
ncbi:MAG: hydroxyethylthiazole kinase [Thermodesulfobacteriota bacterium]